MTADPTSKPNIDFNLLPVTRELPGDLDSPLSVYLKLVGDGPSFLLESVSGGKHVARYSFIGTALNHAYVIRGQTLEHHTPQGIKRIQNMKDEDILVLLRAELKKYKQKNIPNLPRFTGGFVGYLGYDSIRYFEPCMQLTPHPELPDGIFLVADTIVAYDHAFSRLVLITNVPLNGNPKSASALAKTRFGYLPFSTLLAKSLCSSNQCSKWRDTGGAGTLTHKPRSNSS